MNSPATLTCTVVSSTITYGDRGSRPTRLAGQRVQGPRSERRRANSFRVLCALGALPSRSGCTERVGCPVSRPFDLRVGPDRLRFDFAHGKQDVGGRYVGSILGWGNMWGNLGGFFGPWYVGVVKDLTGSFSGGLLGLALLGLIAATVAAFCLHIPDPTRVEAQKAVPATA